MQQAHLGFAMPGAAELAIIALILGLNIALIAIIFSLGRRAGRKEEGQRPPAKPPQTSGRSSPERENEDD